MTKLFQFALAFAALFVVLFFLRTPDTDAEQMIGKYTDTASDFAENSDGLRIHYRDEGNPDGLPIILVHGTAASLHTWEPQIQRLGRKYRMITYTQPGHGLSGPHPADDYSFAGMAEALDLIIQELGIDRFVLGGNSMGGWVAWRYALANPDRVSALLLLDASGMPLRDGEKEPPLNIGFRLLQNPVGRYLAQQYTPRLLVHRSALQSVSVKSVMNKAAVDRYWELLRYPGNRRAAALRAITDREPGYADRISEIAAPVLVIWGAEDQLISVSAARSFDERLSNAEIVIYDETGHLPMEEAPDRTANDIDGFLDRVITSD